MKSYGTEAPRASKSGIGWVKIVQQIENEGLFGEWVSPKELQGLPNLMSLYAIVKRDQHPELRALATQGYVVEPKTTNTKIDGGRRTGDLLLRVTKEA